MRAPWLLALVVLAAGAACGGSYAPDERSTPRALDNSRSVSVTESDAGPVDGETSGGGGPGTKTGDGGADGGATETPDAGASPVCPKSGTKVQQTSSPASVVSVETLQTSTGGSISNAGLPWLAPTLAEKSDDASASCLLTYPTRAAKKLVLTNFGFTVPKGAKIDGIRYEVERRASAVNAVQDLDGRPLVNGTAILSVQLAGSATWGNFDALASYGGPTETFGRTWTAEEVDDLGFGFAFAPWTVVDQGAPAPTAYVDAVRTTIYFTCP